MATILPKTKDYPWPSTDVNAHKILALVRTLMLRGFKYGFGSKIADLDAPPDKAKSHNGTLRVDCSGLVRYALWQQGIKIPDGSWGEDKWAREHGFKVSTFEDAGNEDDRLRAGYLPPSKASDNIGHIFFLLNGKLIESHGSHGPNDSREWGAKSWHKLCRVYVLNPVPS